MRKYAKMLILGFGLGLLAQVAAVPPDQPALDRDALRAAEARIPELFEAGTGKRLRAPVSPEERYVMERVEAEFAEMSRAPVQYTHADGTRLFAHPRSLTHFSRIETGPDGRAYLQCGGYRPPFGDAPADFRFKRDGVGAALDEDDIGTGSVQMHSLPGPATVAVAKNTGPVISVQYLDAAGVGFNDARAVAPVPGNSASTLGAQRRAVLKSALDVWATRLNSNVPLRVTAEFVDHGCTETSPAGTGGPQFLTSNFLHAPQGNTTYPIALATALAGARFAGIESEFSIRLHSRVDEEVCFASMPEGFWYGLDPDVQPATGTFSFFALVVHELAHGLGFLTLVDLDTGQYFGNPPHPDIYSRFLFSETHQSFWPAMTAAQRVTSATDEPNLVWSGAAVNQRAARFLLPPGEVRTDPAVGGDTRFAAFVHGIPPFLDPPGLSAPFAVAENAIDDPPEAGRAPTDACQPLLNQAQASGSIVLATRGSCFFSEKWQHAYDAGARALIVADNVPAEADGALQRNVQMALATRLPIPVWSVTLDVGHGLMANPPTQLTLGYDETAPAQGTNQGRVVMEGSTDSGLSNVSHFSRSLFPPSVMGSSISNTTDAGLPDLVTDLFKDIGWPMADAKQGQFSGSWFKPSRSGEGCQLILEADQQTFVLTCYLYLEGEQVWVIGSGSRDGDRIDFDDVVITRGAEYGSAFDPDAVERIVWGSIRVQIFDCNRALFVFHPTLEPYREFQSTMSKLVAGNCQRTVANQPARELSGSYFDPARSGEGIQIAQEADGVTLVLTLYSYVEGGQMWAIGSGNLVGARVEFADMTLTRGADYGQGFDPDAVERIPFGTVTVDRLDCNLVRVQIEPILPDFEPSDRVLTRIVTRDC